MSCKLLMVCWAAEFFGSDLDFWICYQPQLSSSPMGRLAFCSSLSFDPQAPLAHKQLRCLPFCLLNPAAGRGVPCEAGRKSYGYFVGSASCRGADLPCRWNLGNSPNRDSCQLHRRGVGLKDITQWGMYRLFRNDSTAKVQHAQDDAFIS